MSFSDRLRDAIELVFPSAKAFSEASGIPYPSLRNYISGEKKPGLDAIASILKALAVSPEWLLFEEGPMFPWPAVNQLLKDHFVRFEAHEQERREGYEDEDLGLDTPPTRENVLEQFCGLYNRFGPAGVGLPQWMMANYPTLSPEQIVGVIGGTGSQSNPTQPQAGAPHGGWVSVAEQDWSAWWGAVAELAANGITPGQVLQKFRPPGDDSKGSEPSPRPDITNLMF